MTPPHCHISINLCSINTISHPVILESISNTDFFLILGRWNCEEEISSKTTEGKSWVLRLTDWQRENEKCFISNIEKVLLMIHFLVLLHLRTWAKLHAMLRSLLSFYSCVIHILFHWNLLVTSQDFIWTLVFQDTYLIALISPCSHNYPWGTWVMCYGSRYTFHEIPPVGQFNETKTLACPFFLIHTHGQNSDPHLLSKHRDFMSHNSAFKSLYKIFFNAPCDGKVKGK